MPFAEALGEVGSSVRLISTVEEYRKLAMIEDRASRLRAWAADYEAVHRDVFDVYYRSYSAPGDRDNAVADVARIAPLVRERQARAEALARQTEREFRSPRAPERA
jgi:CHASE1-domain containing sensor protein